MRVLIDTTFAEHAPRSGTGIYLEQLIAALGQIDGVDVVRAVNPRRRPPAGGGSGSLRNAAADLSWIERELPRRAVRARADVIHHPLPARAHRAHHPEVVTVHDLAFERRPGDFARAFRTYAHLVHRDAARHAGAVIAVSETTAADMRELWSVPAERIVVAHHGPGQVGPQDASVPVGEAPASPPGHPRSAADGYFLYVGDAEPRKDVTTLLAAYGRYRTAVGTPHDLVLAGSAEAAGPGIRTEPNPDRERLIALYRGARALVHPARYEGFGMTALEAMTLGTPVIAARSGALVEVCGDAARYYPPGDAVALAALLAQPPFPPPPERAAAFSWLRSAQRHLDAYSLALEASR